MVIQGDGRRRLGEAMRAGLISRIPDTAPEALDREAAKPMRAPTIVAVAARVCPGRIPEVEQLLSVGAAVQNMLLSAHAMGLGAVWKTGEAAYDPGVRAALGLHDDDQIVAFVYLGSQERSPPVRPVSLEDRAWRL